MDGPNPRGSASSLRRGLCTGRLYCASLSKGPFSILVVASVAEFYMSQEIVIGVGWYAEDQWLMLKLVAEDRDALDDTYEQWEAGVTKALAELRNQPGVEAVKVHVEVAGLQRWCREQGRPLDGPARALYVTEQVRKMSSE